MIGYLIVAFLAGFALALWLADRITKTTELHYSGGPIDFDLRCPGCGENLGRQSALLKLPDKLELP